MDRILNMILRQITRQLVSKGIHAGMSRLSSSGAVGGTKSDRRQTRSIPSKRTPPGQVKSNR